MPLTPAQIRALTPSETPLVASEIMGDNRQATLDNAAAIPSTITDVPGFPALGAPGDVLTVDGPGTGLEFVAPAGGGGQADWLGPIIMSADDFGQASDQDPGANMASIQIGEVEIEGSTWLRLDSRRDAAGGVLPNAVRIQGALTTVAAGDFLIGGEIVMQFLDNITGEPLAPSGSLSGLYGGPVFVDGADAETADYSTITMGPNASSSTDMALFPEEHTGFDTPISGPLADDGKLMDGRTRFYFAFKRSLTTLRLYLWSKESSPKLVATDTVTENAGQVGFRIESWNNIHNMRCVAYLRFTADVALPWGPA